MEKLDILCEAWRASIVAGVFFLAAVAVCCVLAIVQSFFMSAIWCSAWRTVKAIALLPVIIFLIVLCEAADAWEGIKDE